MHRLRKISILLFFPSLPFLPSLGQSPKPTESGENLAVNPGFEDVSIFPTSQESKWTLKSSERVPRGWVLSPAYPGELEVIDSAAPEGAHHLRISAPADRAAHIYQGCPQMIAGQAYEISLHYRGGPLHLMMYEYDAEGKFVGEPIFAKVAAPSPSDNKWRKLSGYYRFPTGVVRTSLAMVVPAGKTTEVDHLDMQRFDRSPEILNVRDYGVSGSSFETTASTTADSPSITVQSAGDFEVGHEVMLFGCNPHFADGLVWDMSSVGSREENFEEQVELRGYDGSAGNRASYILDITGDSPPSFRWSDDLGQSWKEPVKITGDWQKLNAGIEVRLSSQDFWNTPRLVSFTVRNHLLSEITGIEGNTLTLGHPVPRSADDCILQHCDSGPLQRAFDRASGEGRNIFIPSGHYRLSHGLVLNRPDGISIEGENEEHTILDLENGQGACITVNGGSSVSFRRLRFRGFSSFSEMKKMAYLPAKGYPHMWGFFAQHCNAITFRSPERVMVENCHATGMSAECFYSGSISRKGNDPPPSRYPKSIIYRNCTVSDCARNAFNNNDFAEGTSVLDCRIENIGGCVWEGASRFVKFMGNYVTNAGPVAMGNIRSRESHFDILPSGQHLVSNNTFEGTLAYGNSYIAASAGATPVIISNNVFVNLNASAIEVSGHGNERNLPAGNVIITGNAIDLTCVSGEPRTRFGISASANNTTISDNQIYTRPGIAPEVTGILLSEPAHHLVVHDNIVRNCNIGLEAVRIRGSVGEILNPQTFKSNGRLPWPRRDTYRYEGYQIVWISNAHTKEPEQFVDGPVIKAFDPDEGVFRLQEGFDLKPNAVFVLRAPRGSSWNIHHNSISNCTQLVTLDVFGGDTASFSDNLLESTETTGETAIKIKGQFQQNNNILAGKLSP